MLQTSLSTSFCLIFRQIRGGGRTFVVHVGGHLDHAEAEVDRQVLEVVVGLQDELPSQLDALSQLVHLVDQHRVKVFVLEGERQP